MAKSRATKRQTRGAGKVAEAYAHPDQSLLMRPEVGTQPQFKKKKPPVTYRYDSSLSPSLDWDGGNGARELGDWLLRVIEEAAARPAPHTLPVPAEFTAADGQVLVSVGSLQEAVAQLRRLSRPFLDWTGKAERLSFDVPTLPLFVHERLSTQAIVKTLVGHKTDTQTDFWALLGDPRHPIADQVLKAYEYPDQWVNRLILGDSLVVMSSLLHYEHLGGQVQMIYIDPPYGVKFGSNFQPFVRKRNVAHNDDADFTREPETVKAYRDTWELGLHSYLTYMRDRLLVARELLTPSGSVFVQISDENLHHVRELLDDVFGTENFCSVIPFAKTASTATNLLSEEFDYLLWYAKERPSIKYRQLFQSKLASTFGSYKYVVHPDGLNFRLMSKEERDNPRLLSEGFRVAQLSFAVSQDPGKPDERIYEFKGVKYDCGANRHWKTTNPVGLDRLVVFQWRLAPQSYLTPLNS